MVNEIVIPNIRVLRVHCLTAANWQRRLKRRLSLPSSCCGTNTKCHTQAG